MSRVCLMLVVALTCAGLAVAADPADCGLSPSASAEANAKALQRALDGGNCEVRIDRPGVYDLDRTVFLDSDTRLVFAEGVTIRKAKTYSNVFVNRGAYEGHSNSNITIRGLRLSVNGNEAIPPAGSPAQGLRGQVAFYRIDRARVEDFRCEDLGTSQYCIHFADFTDVAVERFVIRGRKDGVHFNCGRGFVVRDGVIRTGDDAVAVNAGEWPGGCSPRIGCVENGVVEKLHVLPGTNGNIARVITGSWKEWHPGMRLQRNDIVRRGRNVYAVFPMPLGTNETVSLTGPTHEQGVWKSPEGISFQFLQADGATRAEIRNVVFRDIFCEGNYGIVCGWEVNTPYARLVHPEIPPADYPRIDIALDNVVMDGRPGAPLLRGGAPATVRMNNVECRTGPLVGMPAIDGYRGIRRTIVCTGTVLGRSPDEEFVFESGDAEVDLHLSGCVAPGPVILTCRAPGKVRVHTRDDMTVEKRTATDGRFAELKAQWL